MEMILDDGGHFVTAPPSSWGAPHVSLANFQPMLEARSEWPDISSRGGGNARVNANEPVVDGNH